jgi:hypothetical protein
LPPLNITTSDTLTGLNVSTSTFDSVYVRVADSLTGQTVLETVILRGFGTLPARIFQGNCQTYKLAFFRFCRGTIANDSVVIYRRVGSNCFAGGNGDNTPIQNINLFPNPSSERLSISFRVAQTAANDILLELRNSTGQVVHSENLGSRNVGEHQYALSQLGNLQRGLYYLVVKVNGRVVANKSWVKN